MHVSPKGQVTIPKELRERLGIRPGTRVEFLAEGDHLIIRKLPGDGSRGKALVAWMRDRGDSGMSTDEIMALTRDA